MVIVVMVIAVLAVSLIQVSAAATHRAAYQGSCAAAHQSAN